MSSIRQHPVFQTIRDAAYYGKRGMPDDHDLDALKLSPGTRREVLDTCRRVADIHDRGAQQDAWAAGDEAAWQLIHSLPEEQQDHQRYYRAKDPLADIDDPIELAARIPRI